MQFILNYGANQSVAQSLSVFLFLFALELHTVTWTTIMILTETVEVIFFLN
jgi:hypothetical protein